MTTTIKGVTNGFTVETYGFTGGHYFLRQAIATDFDQACLIAKNQRQLAEDEARTREECWHERL